MNHCFRARRHQQRGVTAFCILFAITILAILSHNIVNQALMNYHLGARVRDTVVLQQLTDSAVAQVLYHLNRDNRTQAVAPIRESFGIALIETSETEKGLALRVVAHTPNAERARASSQTIFHLARDGKGQWRVATAQEGPVPFGG